MEAALEYLFLGIWYLMLPIKLNTPEVPTCCMLVRSVLQNLLLSFIDSKTSPRPTHTNISETEIHCTIDRVSLLLCNIFFSYWYPKPGNMSCNCWHLRLEETHYFLYVICYYTIELTYFII